jgi:hypothetical protein
LPTIHMLTPHIKRKKCKKKKKLYILPHETHAAEKRKELRCSKKEKRKKREEEGRNPPSRPATSQRLTSAGSRQPWVCETQVFFGKRFAPLGGVRFKSHFFSISSGCRKDLAIALSHLAATSQKVNDRSLRPTAGSRRPWVWFFLFFFSFFFFFRWVYLFWFLG